MAIPRRNINIIKGEIPQVIKTFLQGKSTKGESVELFERKFADYMGVKYAFSVSSGRASLYIILRALDFPARAEVIIPAYTDESVPATIINAGLKPIFVDINKDDFNIDIKKLENKINNNTKAIIATHIFGNLCDIGNILEICNKSGIIMIEDCAHAPSASLGEKGKAGSFGKLSYFSFSSTKHFHAYGGGCILTNDDNLANKIKFSLNTVGTVSLASLAKEIIFTWIMALFTNRILFTYLIYPILVISSVFMKDDFMVLVFNKIFQKKKNNIPDVKRLSNLQARVALMRLRLLENENKKRKENVAVLRDSLNENILNFAMKYSKESVYYFYIISIRDKESLSRYLLLNGIDTGKYLMRNVADICNSRESYPVTEWAYEHGLQIPVYASLEKKDMLHIADVLNKVNKIFEF